MYIYPSIFRDFGGSWFNGNKVVVNGAEAVGRARLVRRRSCEATRPPACENWNWPDIADAFSQGTLGCLHRRALSAAVLTDPEKSKVIGKIGFARWPKGPTGKRVTSIWNWGFPINAALSEKQEGDAGCSSSGRRSAETQARTSWKFAGPCKRSGVNRTSLWKSPEYAR